MSSPFQNLGAGIAAILIAAFPAAGTIVRFENVNLPLARELEGLQAVPGYGDHVTDPGTGGFANSFAKGKGWTPKIALDFSAGNDIKTVNSWRDGWDGGSGANYLLDGDAGEPYYYWYTFTPKGGAGVLVNSLDLNGVGTHPNRIDWTIFAGSKTGKVLARGSTGSFSSDKTKVELGMREPHYGVTILELVHTGTRIALAVDDLNFDQVRPDPAAADAGDALVVVGTRKQLLVDDYVIASSSKVRRELGKVTKLNGAKPVLTARFYGTVLYDQGKFKLWYLGYPYGYAESNDGVHFREVAKLTGLNNQSPAEGGTFFIDPHETDPAHRYKACFAHRTMRAALAHSADGIHWKEYNNGNPVTHRAADTVNYMTWDEDAKVYRLFTRTDYQSHLGAKMEVRGTRSMINPDIKADPTAWKLVRRWRFDRDDPEEWKRRQIYGLSDWIYHGVHFALMMVFEWPDDHSEGPTDYRKRHKRDVLEFYIATSRDGDSWDLRWVYAGRPMIPRGPEGAWDKDMLAPASEVVTHNDKHWLYYDGYNERHSVFGQGNEGAEYGIGVATLRLDGFVALVAGDEPATVVTQPFTLEGEDLQINVQGDEFLVEVLDRKGHPISGFAAADATRYEKVDELRLKPAWKGGARIANLKGQAIRLRFQFKNARLYSFKVE